LEPVAVEPAVSVGNLQLGFHALSMIPQQLQYPTNALPALSAAAASRIDVAWALTAGGRRRLLQLSVGQCIADAYIHDLNIPS
jgi:hypothetical protein